MNAARRLALTVVIALVCSGAVADAASAITGVDLSTYHRVGRHDLPVGTGADLLASEASGVAYDPSNQTLYVVGDEGTSIAHVALDGTLIDTMPLNPGDFEDTEGITYVGGGQFVITEERLRQVDRFTYAAGQTLTRADVDTVKLGTTVGNIGLEGVSNDPDNNGLVLVKETGPESIFTTQLDWAAGTATNGSSTTDESIDLFPPADAGLNDFSDVFALDNLPSLTGHTDATHLLMISQESGKIINIDRTGAVSSSLRLRRDADNALSVAEQTIEGISMDDAGTLYVVSEQGGGLNHPQLWVYQPTATPDAAPTAVSLTSSSSSLPESTSTAGRHKLADVDVTDADGLGVNDLAVTGPDAADFEVDDTGLYLKAGVALDYEAKSTYSVSVTADDTTVGATPDVTSSAYTLTITNVADGGGSTGVIVSEVAPWGSSAAGYAADWWELTNTGTEPVDLTGWKMDDNSASIGTAVALNGVSLLQPGQSAILLEGDATKVTSFETAWFGGAPPAGVQVGYYSGGGVGLSTGGDAVAVFDANGDLVTGVAFGTATTNVSFDNAAGAGSATLPLPAITALSTVGQAGAITNSATEIGSPGALDWPIRITEVDPTGSSNTTYGADWFEVTNTGTVTIPLSGWMMDDSSHMLANGVPMVDVDSLAPGASAVFVEGDAAKEAAFRAAWYGGDMSLAVGSYTGSGVGLSSGGDEVNLYDSIGNHVTGIAFGTATTNVSFDNHAELGTATLPVPSVTAVSARGAFGARTAGLETGSPGTIAPDTTAPAITVGAHPDTYDIGDQIHITCAAADESRGAGLDAAHTDCADLDVPASTYGLGQHTITWTATDYAGNARTTPVTFTVATTPPAPDPTPDPTPTPTPPATVPPVPVPPAPNPPAAPAKPVLTRPTSAKTGSLRKGVSTKLTHLKPKSKVTLTVRYAGKTLVTIKATAGASGTATVKVKLSKARLAKLKGKTLTLRYAITGADGKTTVLTTTLKVTG
jgi:uncharacterized protein YjiK